MILGLARVCDWAKTGCFENLSIDRLIGLLENEDSPIVFQLKDTQKKINSFLPELRKIRHKRIAHNDLKTHLEDLHKTIKNRNIDGALKELQKFSDIISLHYHDVESQVLNPYYPLGDGPELFMEYLRAGIDAYWKRGANK